MGEQSWLISISMGGNRTERLVTWKKWKISYPLQHRRKYKTTIRMDGKEIFNYRIKTQLF